MKIGISCGSGGHLSQILELMDAFDEHDTFFVIVKSQVTEGINLNNVRFIIHPPKPKKLFGISLHKLQLTLYYIRLSIPCLRIILVDKPDVLVGHGGEATLILFYFAKIFRTNLIFIETVERVNELSGTGKLVYPITDLFIVQWETLKNKYENSVYWGRII